MDALLHDLRYAFRSLRRTPGFTAAAVLTIALGIGATTAIVTVIRAVLLQPLPYPDADRLVALWASQGGDPQRMAAYTDLMDYRAQSRTFEDIGVIRGMSVNLTGGEQPERLGGEFITARTFAVLGARAARGRLFRDDETTPGTGQPVAVLSDGAWRSRFGGRQDIVGRTIVLNNVPHVVIGVTPPGYVSPFGGAVDVWLPITSIPSRSTLDRGVMNVYAVGRLRPGVSAGEAQRDLDVIAARIAAVYPASNAGVGATVVPLREQIAGSVERPLLTLLIAAVAVLLIACANVASLHLTRSAARRHEITVRAAMGARVGRLVRQLLTESVVLSLAGGAAGVLLAVWGVAALVQLVPGGLPAFGPVAVDASVLGVALAVTLLAGVSFGLAPAWFAARTALAGELRVREGGAGPGRFDSRSVLVGAELALCIVLLVGAGLLTRSLARLRTVDPGFRPDHVLTFQFRLPPTKYDTPEKQAAFFAQAVTQVRAVPGVTSAALVQATPFTGNWSRAPYEVEGRPAPGPGQAPEALSETVTDGYFGTMGIPLIEGRDVTADDRLGTLPVAVVSRTLAQRAWPGVSAVGRRLRAPGDSAWITVVGVAGDAKHLSLGDPPTAAIYRPAAQAPFIFSNVVTRVSGDPLSAYPAVRAAIWSVDRDQPVWAPRSLDELISGSMGQLRFTMVLTGLFAALALALAAVGVYGVMAYTVMQRTREVGLRLAVGARPAQVVREIVARGARVTAVALVLGLVAALGLARLLASQLFEVRPGDPLTYLAVAVTLTVVALVAAWLPARRAARVDPMTALRAD